jgi:hypothetical protein
MQSNVKKLKAACNTTFGTGPLTLAAAPPPVCLHAGTGDARREDLGSAVKLRPLQDGRTLVGFGLTIFLRPESGRDPAEIRQPPPIRRRYSRLPATETDAAPSSMA